MLDDDAVIARVADAHAHMGPERRRAWNRAVRACTADVLTAAQKVVVLALADYADYQDGTNAHPGEVRLAEECGLTARAVRSALAAAQAAGLIAKTAPANVRAGRAAVYRLVLTNGMTGTAVPVVDAITGTAVPVDKPVTGTAVPVDNFITGTATTPSPERPFLPPSKHLPNTGVSPKPGTSPEPPITDTHQRPRSRFCADHPRGYAGSCGPCANARTAFNAWQTADDDAAAERAAVDDLERRRRRRLIDRCQDCDEHGRIEVQTPTGDALVPCTHPRIEDGQDERGRAHG